MNENLIKDTVAESAIRLWTDHYGDIPKERKDLIKRLLISATDTPTIPSEEIGVTPPITRPVRDYQRPDINIIDVDIAKWNVRANIEREYHKMLETTYGSILPPLGTIVCASVDLKPPYRDARVAGWVPKYGNRKKHVVMEPIDGDYKMYCLSTGDFQRLLQWAGI